MLSVNRVVRLFVWILLVLPSVPALAKAHCWCKVGPPSSPYYDLGAIGSYGTQIGNDKKCQSLCDDTSTQLLQDPARKTSICKMAKGASFAAWSAVGTKPYIEGKSFACGPTPKPGRIAFGTSPGASRGIRVNGKPAHISAPSVVPVPKMGHFTTFQFTDFLSFHVQRWTYAARLYRDGVLIEEQSALSPKTFAGSVLVVFTGQPNAFVHGHHWTIEWQYHGSGFTDGSVTFYIP